MLKGFSLNRINTIRKTESIWLLVVGFLLLSGCLETKDRPAVADVNDLSNFSNFDNSLFPLSVGNEWRYNYHSNTVRAQVEMTELVDGTQTFIVVHKFSGEKVRFWYFENESGIFMAKSKNRFSEKDNLPHLPIILKSKLEKGNSWNYVAGSEEFNTTYQVESLGKQKVSTTAGEFTAYGFKIKAISKDKTLEFTSWYAPDVGFVKQTEASDENGVETTVFDLSSYTLRKQ